MTSDSWLCVKHGATVWRRVQGETVVLDLEHDAYLALNATATVLWEALANGARHEDLVAKLVELYAVDATSAAADVTTFLSQCRARGLIEAQ